MILDEIRGRTSLYLSHRELNRTSKRVYEKRLFGVTRYIFHEDTVEDGNKTLRDHYVTSAVAVRLARAQHQLEKKLSLDTIHARTRWHDKLVKLMHDRLAVTERQIHFMEHVARHLSGCQKRELEAVLRLRTQLQASIAVLER